jgi:hypothetical protein
MKRPEPKESVNLNRGRLLCRGTRLRRDAYAATSASLPFVLSAFIGVHRRSSGAPGEAWLI